MTAARVRLDWVTEEVRRVVDASALGSPDVFHYSIPVLDEIGDGRVEPAGEIGSGKLLLSGGEVLISKLNPRLPRVLTAAPHDMPTVASTEFVALRTGSGIDTRFLVYWLLAETTRQMLDGATMSVTRSQQRARPEVLTKSWLSLPPLATQRAIADYLDTDTARIDALIAKKQRMIELIEMRRKVVVVEHVSGHGSDGGVRLRHVSRLVRGSGFPHEYQGLDEGDLPFFKVGDLSRPGNDPYLVSCGNWVSTATANSLRATVVPPGAVMFPKIGAALAGGVRRIATVPCVCDNNVLAVVPTGVEERYLRFWLSTVDLAEIANPGPVPSLDDDALRDLLVPVADCERQGEIADRLDVASASMSNAVTRLQSQIGLLRERRQALISSAVTGELEVPGVAA